MTSLSTLLSDCDATGGQFLLTHWGDSLALGFRGEPDFIRRCYNWAINRDVAKGELHWPFDKDGRLAYVLVENHAAIERGLAEQFRDEIILTHEVPWEREARWDNEADIYFEGEVNQTKVDQLAAKRAADFMATHVTSEPFLLKLPTSLAPVYETAGSFGVSDGNGGED